VKIDGRKIKITHPDKLLFPQSGITKRKLVEYYRKIADRMLPHLKNRPLNMQRFPEGIDKRGFFQQHVPNHFPDWIKRVRTPKIDGPGEVEHVLCEDAATLVYLVNQGCITPHIWLSRTEHLKRPDMMVFDIDPPKATYAVTVREAARDLIALLKTRGLSAVVKTSGSKGYHIIVPLTEDTDFGTIRRRAESIANALVSRKPDRYSTEQRIEKRWLKIFIDTQRNAYGQTMAPPYAVRAKPGAPVSTPIREDDLQRTTLNPRKYTVKNLFKRLGQIPNPWNDPFS
jgi:bifunctional non-homologous end joining protein LigD